MSYDTKASASCATLQISSLFIRNKTFSGCNFYKRKLTYMLLLSLTWKKSNFFPHMYKENSLSKGQWKVTKELERGGWKITLVEKIH